jgi:hypothetical protein
MKHPLTGDSKDVVPRVPSLHPALTSISDILRVLDGNIMGMIYIDTLW